MSNVSEDEAKTEARWDAAARLAAGINDAGVGKRRRTFFILFAVLYVLSLGLGVVLALIFLPGGGESGGDSADISSERLTAQLVVFAVGIVIFVAGFIWGVSTGHYITRWKAVSSPLNRAEKKSVRRQIAGKQQADPVRLPIVLAIARQTRKGTWGIVPIFGALVLFAISTAIGTDATYIRVIELIAGLLFIVAMVQLAVAYRRAGRFIQANGGRI